MSELSQVIEKVSKNTIGYQEAKDKDSFLVGISVGVHKTEEYYKNIIKNLTNDRDNYKKAYENTVVDLKTVSSIIKRYSED